MENLSNNIRILSSQRVLNLSAMIYFLDLTCEKSVPIDMFRHYYYDFFWCEVLFRSPILQKLKVQRTRTELDKVQREYFFSLLKKANFFRFFLFIYMHENLIMILLAALKSHLFCLYFCKFTRYIIQPYSRREATIKDRTDESASVTVQKT